MHWKFLIILCSVMAMSSLLISLSLVHTVKKNVETEIEEFRAEELNKVKETLKNYIDIAFETVNSNYQHAQDREYLQKRYGQELKNIIDVANDFIEDAKSLVAKGDLTLEQAQQRAIENVRRIRYAQGTGYVWINDMGRPYPRMIMHPTVPDLDGKVLDDAKYNCALGEKKNLFAAFVDVCAKDGEGFVDYLWPKPTKGGLTQEQPKLSYVRLIPDWGWIIGTGIYVDDAVRDAIEKVKIDIGKMRYDNKIGYFWINDMGRPYPRMIMHPTVPELDGKVLDDAKYNCALGEKKNLFAAFVDVCAKDGEGFVDYLWPKPTKDGLTQEQPKLSYVRLYKPLGWIIGTGVYIDSIDVAVAEKASALRGQIKGIFLKIMAVSLIVSIIAFFAFWIMAKKITTPLRACSEFAERISSGNLDGTDIEVESRDEVGQLALSLRQMGIYLKKTIGEIVAASRSLSDGSSEQAASLEQTSASLEEITAMTKQNAENASQGNILMSETKETIGQANTAMIELTESMKHVSDASQKTKNIIKTIDEIAFQTNLLALNAAVEAARAGESGAGFAVVADEVRNLAMRASEAAKNTAEIIEKTVREIENGHTLLSTTSTIFSEVSNRICKASDMVQEISLASEEQVKGIEQINQALFNISRVTQQNAGNAQNMVSIVDKFQLSESADAN
ncbi:MAG: cache domain-containing protein [bacterium]